MAFFRSLESREPPARRLFSDPTADSFLTLPLRIAAAATRLPAVRALVRESLDRLWPGARASGVARTRLIDDALRIAAAQGFEQVVVLGAGFDARSSRIPELADVRLFEVDHPRTFARKRACMAGAGSTRPRHVTWVEADLLNPGLIETLSGAGFDSATRSFFVCEGVTNYLSEEAVRGLLSLVSRCATGSRILFTYVHAEVLTDPSKFHGTDRLNRTLKSDDERWTFGLRPEQLADFLAEQGLELVWDRGSREYRAAYWGERGRHLCGYEFYRAALAEVALVDERGSDAEGQ
jgi:methyltransferase (TIGR00027 family)